TDTKPLGVLHLSDYSILSSGSEITRKSKYAFKLSSPESVPHQHQSHVFYADNAQSLENWTHSLQIHINQAMAALISMAEASERLDQQIREAEKFRASQLRIGSNGAELSIIDRVLDRLQLEESTLEKVDTTSSSQTQETRDPFERVPIALVQSYENNNENWSTSSSVPNTSSNTSSNLDYIFGAGQQQPPKLSMESIRDQQQLMLSSSTSLLGSQSSQTVNAGNNNTNGYPTFSEHLSISSMSDGSKSARQSMESQGRSSIYNRNRIGSVSSPLLYPTRTGAPATLSLDNNLSSATSTIDSPYSSPTLKSQSHISPSISDVPPSPATFYRVLENMRETESINSSTSISSMASSDNASTAVDLTLDNSTTTSTDTCSLGSKSGSGLFMGLVTGGKHRKEKERRAQSSNGSSHSGSGGSPALKLFSSSICSYNGCEQPSKTCPFHSKKNSLDSSKKEIKKIKKFWPGSDKTSQALSASSSSLHGGSDRSISPGPPFPSPKFSGSRGLSSKSMTSLSREDEVDFDSTPMPQLSNPLLNIFPLPTRRRSPSVSIVDDALVVAQLRQQNPQQRQIRSADLLQQRQQQLELLSAGTQQAQSGTPPHTLSPAPTLPLPPVPPQAFCAAESITIPGTLSRKLGLPMGEEFGELPDKTAVATSPSDGNFFVVNHYRAMQKLQAKARKHQHSPNSAGGSGLSISSPIPEIPSALMSSTPVQSNFSVDQQRLQALQLQQQQLQSSLQLGGVSRHIVAPDELASAIEQEVQEMRRQQEQIREAQKNRPTSMVSSLPKNYKSLEIPVGLFSVSETPSDCSLSADNAKSEEFSPLSSTSGNTRPGSSEGERIISYQEQLACGSTVSGSNVQPVERQRSPISGITSAPSSHRIHHHQQQQQSSRKSTPPTSIEFKRSELAPPSSDTSNNSGIGISLTAATPTSEDTLQFVQSQPEQVQRVPLSQRSQTFGEKQDFPVRSLPPPKRHVNNHKLAYQADLVSSDAYMAHTQRGGQPRRSSAAAAVSMTSAPSHKHDEISTVMESTTQEESSFDVDGSEVPTFKFTSSTTSTRVMRPTHMARRNSSSPVLIRLSEQGGQNISPLINNDATRTFAGNTPSSEVQRPGLYSSRSGSSISASTVSSTLCSVVTSGRSEHSEESGDQNLSGLALSGTFTPSLQSPTMLSPASEEFPASPIPLNNSSRFRSILSPLASSTPISGSKTAQSPPGSPAAASTIRMQLIADETSTSPNTQCDDDTDDNIGSPSFGIKCPQATTSARDQATRDMMQAAQSFVFPAPPPSITTTASVDASSINDQQPPSSRSSVDYFSSAAGSSGASSPTGEKDYDEDGERPHAGSLIVPASALRAHAASLDLYPGLRKLSLFTAAVGGVPPPALINGRRKGSAESASARERKMSTASSFSRMESDEDRDYEYDDDDEDQVVDLHHDEDWAGNLKSLKRTNNEQPPVPSLSIDSTMTSPSKPKFSIPAPTSPLPPPPPQELQAGSRNDNAHTTSLPSPSSSSPSRLIHDAPAPGMVYTSQLKPPPAPPMTRTGSKSNIATSPSSPSSPSSSESLTPSKLVVNPPTIPRRSPQRSGPMSPTNLRLQRSTPQPDDD
ncbi:hypothetical protein BGZ49_002632, partial [Haplosporangium sp. Z 27]